MWSQFGAIRVIHILDRKDREKRVLELGKKLNIPLQFFNVSRHSNGKQGCYESHVKIMQECLDQNIDKVLIFEDDFDIGVFTWERMLEVTKFMNSDTEWDILYLGCFPDIWKGYHTHEIGHIYKTQATQTHSYVVSRLFMQKMIARPFDGTPIDEVFKDSARCYAVFPSIFKQSNSSSDVSSISWISTFPGKEYVTRGFEEYASHIGVPLGKVFLWSLALCVALKLMFVLTSNRKNGRRSLR